MDKIEFTNPQGPLLMCDVEMSSVGNNYLDVAKECDWSYFM